MSILSRYSYVLLSLILVAAGIVAAFFVPNAEAMSMVTLLVGGALIVYWVMARRGNLTPVNPEKRIRRGRSSDRPVVVHFYSDFSVVSLLQRPFAAKAEREYKGACDFVYIEVGHREAAAAAESEKAALGHFVLYDAAGNFVEKTGSLSVSKLEALVKRPN